MTWLLRLLVAYTIFAFVIVIRPNISIFLSLLLNLISNIVYYTNPQDPGIVPEFFWYGRNRPPQQPYDVVLGEVVIGLATGDAFSNVDPNNPEEQNFFCPDFRCKNNGSTIQAHIVLFDIKSNLDSDGNGLADFKGYTDRYGKAVSNCTSVGLDCIPTVVEHAPVARTEHRDDRDLNLSAAGAMEFDTSPPGEYWIKYPN